MRRKAHPHEHVGELNIVPYLDIMVNLVMFMLMSMTGFITFNMINVTIPDVSDAAPPVDPSTPRPKQEEQFVLNISISSRGFFIAATGGVLPGVAATDPKAPPADPNAAQPTIPLIEVTVKNKDGSTTKKMDYDYQALTNKMVAIKKQYPDKSQYFLAADRSVKYEAIVLTMDSTRGDSKQPLFPDVAFAAVSQ